MNAIGSASLIKQSTASCAVGRGERLGTEGASLSLRRSGWDSSMGSQRVSSEAFLLRRATRMAGVVVESEGKCRGSGHFIVDFLEISPG